MRRPEKGRHLNIKSDRDAVYFWGHNDASVSCDMVCVWGGVFVCTSCEVNGTRMPMPPDRVV